MADQQPLQRESSLGTDELAIAETTAPSQIKNDEDDDDMNNLPPGRMHATTSLGNIRLKGTPANKAMSMPVLPDAASTSSGGSGSRSKSGSFVLNSNDPHPFHHHDAGSTTSMSSLEDLGVDQDILYDRAGLQDDLQSVGSKKSHASSQKVVSNLPPVNERLSEDTLEDVHAFSDVKVISISSNASRGANSMTTNELKALDPLMEDDDEDDDSINDLPSESLSNMPPVILTNMENLTLSAQGASGEDSVAAAASQSAAGGTSSLAPSAN